MKHGKLRAALLPVLAALLVLSAFPAAAETDVAAVFEAQQQTIRIFDDTAKKMTEIYGLAEKLAGSAAEAEPAELLQDSQFENAYELLMIRACTDESLADAAAFWAEQREAVLTEEGGGDEELAPAA